MHSTISVSNYITVRGKTLQLLPEGRALVLADGKVYLGKLIHPETDTLAETASPVAGPKSDE